MKRIAAFALLLAATTGCRSYYYQHTTPYGERHEVWVQSFLSDVNITDLKIESSEATVELKSYQNEVNNEAIAAITEGVSKAVLSSLGGI